MRRVAVTGVGLVTPLACGTDASWSKLINGESGLGAITNFDVSDIPSKIAGQVPRSEDKNARAQGLFNPDDWVPTKEQRRMDTFIQYGMAATAHAVEDAGWTPEDEEPLIRTGVIPGLTLLELEQDMVGFTHKNRFYYLAIFFARSIIFFNFHFTLLQIDLKEIL